MYATLHDGSRGEGAGVQRNASYERKQLTTVCLKASFERNIVYRTMDSIIRYAFILFL